MSEFAKVIIIISGIVLCLNLSLFIKFRFQLIFKITLTFGITVGLIAILAYYLGVHGLNLNTILFIVIPGSLVTTISAISLSLFIIRPLGKLTGHADRIALGEIDLDDLDIRQSDEIGKLAQTFNSMTGMLRHKSMILQQVAEGDFSVEVELASDSDALGRTICEMTESLSMMVHRVSDVISRVRSGSEQIALSSQNLSQGASEQAGTLEQLSSSVEEMNRQSHGNSKAVEDANSLAVKAKDEALGGSRDMGDVKHAMEAISSSSDEIRKIVKVIDDIAFQINLLALNANVEAARAGKYGKGFAVVAGEVRNLAVKSAESLQVTSEMVDKSADRVREGNIAVERAMKQLDAIVDGSTRVAELMNTIAEATERQSVSLDQMNTGIQQINVVTQSNSSGAEESASAAEELSGQAFQLEQMISRFVVREKEIDECLALRRKGDFT